MRFRLLRPREFAQRLRNAARLQPEVVEEYLDAHSEEWEALAEPLTPMMLLTSSKNSIRKLPPTCLLNWIPHSRSQRARRNASRDLGASVLEEPCL